MAFAAFISPLAFQLFGVRSAAVRDLPGTLRRVVRLEYREVELVSFPGYAADTPRDGFGPLAGMKPADIRRDIRDADLRVVSCHFKLQELEGNALATALDWAHGVGVCEIIVSDVSPSETRADWDRNIDRLSRAADAVSRSGITLGLHTSSDLWRPFDGGSVLDELSRRTPAAKLNPQLDLSSTLSRAVDPAQLLAQLGRRIHSLHLRGAARQRPVPAQRLIPYWIG